MVIRTCSALPYIACLRETTGEGYGHGSIHHAFAHMPTRTGDRRQTKQQSGPTNAVLKTKRLDVAHTLLQLLQFLLEVGIFLGHFFVLGLPFVSRLFQGLDFTLVVTGLDVGLSQSRIGGSVTGGTSRSRNLLFVGLSQGLV